MSALEALIWRKEYRAKLQSPGTRSNIALLDWD
jgi:hypothetical protein